MKVMARFRPVSKEEQLRLDLNGGGHPAQQPAADHRDVVIFDEADPTIVQVSRACFGSPRLDGPGRSGNDLQFQRHQANKESLH